MNLIVAISEINGKFVIGIDNKIPWNNPEDLRFFRMTTLNKTVVMGRKTFESIGKPLPERKNIILSRSIKENVVFPNKEVQVYAHIDDFLQQDINHKEVFVCGGEQIYNEFLKKGLVQKIYISKIKESCFDEKNKKLLQDAEHKIDDHSFAYFDYDYVQKNFNMTQSIHNKGFLVEIYESKGSCKT